MSGLVESGVKSLRLSEDSVLKRFLVIYEFVSRSVWDGLCVNRIQGLSQISYHQQCAAGPLFGAQIWPTDTPFLRARNPKSRVSVTKIWRFFGAFAVVY